MGTKTSIEWTRGDDGSSGTTWNPIRGCSRVSAGCEHCYAETQAARFCGIGQPYHGLVRRTDRGRAQWTGTVRVVPEHLDDPLRWKRPRRVFVNSMSDLFHESLDDSVIVEVFARMMAAPQHTFQVLTKRADRMRRELRAPDFENRVRLAVESLPERCDRHHAAVRDWPLSNVHVGVSCEDQRSFDERAPDLAATPATVRFLSLEPLLGPIDTRQSWERGIDAMVGGIPPGNERATWLEILGYGSQAWVIVGGESGPHARPCDVAWIRSIVEQCREASVACFVKQLGARPVAQHPMERGALIDVKCADRKGGDPSEWTDDLRVREFPR